ncbi:hypothetical protein HSBAA_PA_4070 (plasmid) [Vreelandella sulfidaeris]|uniref:TraG N-terminal Proteobacteria domain-containing protein n=1 Tax=Vreelandella sulfidaeris TaxID=115553 RepID=A0A455USX2_9GAMM|nr:hypothetical protein HSBAA_PA_4070 [Halomonas sulfidaeris]
MPSNLDGIAQLFSSDMAGYFFAILQAFVIGLAPIVFAAVLVPGLGKKMGTSYAQVMTWLILWWPGLAIVNYIMMLYFQGRQRDTSLMVSPWPI